MARKTIAQVEAELARTRAELADAQAAAKRAATPLDPRRPAVPDPAALPAYDPAVAPAPVTDDGLVGEIVDFDTLDVVTGDRLRGFGLVVDDDEAGLTVVPFTPLGLPVPRDDVKRRGADDDVEVR